MLKKKGSGSPLKSDQGKSTVKVSNSARPKKVFDKKKLQQLNNVLTEALIDSKAAYTPTKPFRKKAEMPASQVEAETKAKKKAPKKNNDKQKAFNDARDLHVNQSLAKHDAFFAKYSGEIKKRHEAGEKISVIRKALEEKKDGPGKQSMHIVYYCLNRLGLIETKNDKALVARHDEIRKALKDGKK